MTEMVGLPFETNVVDRRRLSLARARQTARAADDLDYVGLLECRQADDGREAVIVEVDVERPQRPVHPIARRERIAIVFESQQDALPRVYALRSDFPQVPHLNLEQFELPRSICLYDEPTRDVLLRWTPHSLVESIRSWLARTATGDLHANDQPLEPLLVDARGMVVVPELLGIVKGSVVASLALRRVSPDSARFPSFIADPVDPSASKPPSHVATVFEGEPREHGVIRSAPGDLKSLADAAAKHGLDLIKQLQNRLKDWHRSDHLRLLADAKLVLVVVFPKTRGTNDRIEARDVWAFQCDFSVGEIGLALGVFEKRHKHLGLVFEPPERPACEDITVLPLVAVWAYSRSFAAQMAGTGRFGDRAILQVGVGALGSQILLNLVRSGIGDWCLVDNDTLLPHNLARHALDGNAVGRAKAECMAALVNDVIDGKKVAKAIVANVLDPCGSEEDLLQAYGVADIILDASASVAVSRHLALGVNSPARRVSVFFTPSGSALVVLAEDAERRCPLDSLEMQYYRLILSTPSLREHLKPPPGRIRYSVSCRDVSSQIPQDVACLHASLASNAIKRLLQRGEAFGGIWTLTGEMHEVQFTAVPLSPAIERAASGWRVRTDEALLRALAVRRTYRLPNETGGVLLGSYDMQRKIIYLVAEIPSPPDSVEQPALYIRGCDGLRGRVEEAKAATDHNVQYVGEWHSHPAGDGVLPSQPDTKVMEWLREEMRAEGHPAVMLIVGDVPNVGFHVACYDADQEEPDAGVGM